MKYSTPIYMMAILGCVALAYAGHALHTLYVKQIIYGAVKQECLK